MSFFKSTVCVHIFLMLLCFSNHAEGRGFLPGYPSIKGTVVDSATGKPIEGAVIVAQWTKQHGFGLTYHTLEKMTETQTDKNGAFTLNGTNAWFVEPPEMIIYKEGYLPWRNDSIFPSSNTVKDHVWNNNVTYKLDVYSGEHSYGKIESFIHYGIMGYDEKTLPIFTGKMRKLSSEIRRRENTLIDLKFYAKIIDNETNKPIDGVIIIASDRHNKNSHGTSDQDGNIIITGEYPMLEHPPSIVVYKKGYLVQSSWNYGGVSLHSFKWTTGYVFRLKRCDIQSSWKSLDWHIGQLDEKSNQLLLNLITHEKNEK